MGGFHWGVYAFFDYDGQPIYVGKTHEMLRSRIQRHLTNQRTDAVAMSVLDPFEVYKVKVWPLPQFQEINTKDKKDSDFKNASAYLDALEGTIYRDMVKKSEFGVVLNEKNPKSDQKVEIPLSCEGCIVSEEVLKLRSHPDIRIARRALTISRLAQVISEREVSGGLRRVLLAQAKRLEYLAKKRYEDLGGAAIVPTETDNDDDND